MAHTLMGSSQLRAIFFTFLLVHFSLSMKYVVGADSMDLECLKVPSTNFLTSLRTTIEAIRSIVSVVAPFVNIIGDARESYAVADCLELLDYSTNELNWTIRTTENTNANVISTGNRRSDLKTWLSAASGNQETCADGFGDSNSIVKDLIVGPLGELTSQVIQVLGMVAEGPSGGHAERKAREGNNFPSWMRVRDRGLLQGPVNVKMADVVVAQDGSGNFTTIMEAVLAAPDYSARRYVIHIKKGLYNEYVDIKKKKWNLMMTGDGMGVTVISGNHNVVDGWTTFRSATFAVSALGFIARDLTIENTAGPLKHQAVALRSDSDLSVFFRCDIKGYQDTLYAHSLRQFYSKCTITGTVDFIFGDGQVVFQNCTILAGKPLADQKNTITAQGRIQPGQTSGFSFQFCNFSANFDLLPSVNSTHTYLGRPWKQYSKTVVMQSYLSDAIRPEGWTYWNDTTLYYLESLYYAEFENYGPGYNVTSRVKWLGYHRLNDSRQATNFTVSEFIDGDLWLPSTGIGFTAGLST
ncbi:hypothetical protein IFM89_014839 [Coptis chinensis]|uniref:Pectinesterase n=1 Tax=Coptis chinensis TaxID=261450 RepID=A0A835IBC3_9MAGN|nr:hypothetical protein IFM89_014839 [Coptis chinensis]